jgi:Arc/MetJ-type ribon-helix-helix transcriptional regulator
MPSRASDRLVERIRRGDYPDMSEVVDAILADSDGDARKAIESLVTLNRYLMRENNRLIASVSPGLMRGSGGHRY